MESVDLQLAGVRRRRPIPRLSKRAPDALIEGADVFLVKCVIQGPLRYRVTHLAKLGQGLSGNASGRGMLRDEVGVFGLKFRKFMLQGVERLGRYDRFVLLVLERAILRYKFAKLLGALLYLTGNLHASTLLEDHARFGAHQRYYNCYSRWRRGGSTECRDNS